MNYFTAYYKVKKEDELNRNWWRCLSDCIRGQRQMKLETEDKEPIDQAHCWRPAVL